jgi:segregation and condensation protein B
MEDVETIHENNGVLPEENLPVAAMAASDDEHSTEPEAGAYDAAESGAGDEGGTFDDDGPEFTGMLVAEGWESAPTADPEDRLKAIIEAVIYVTDSPLSAEQIGSALGEPLERVQAILAKLVADYSAPSRGLTVREVAGGYKMATKPEHHEDIRKFVRNLQPAFKLSLAALETLAVVAYKQPVTAPEIMEIRGVQGAGVLKTLLDRKLIATAGRKDVLGKPILYKTTQEFLLHFGLSSLAELPTLKEFEELGRLALTDAETPPDVEGAGPEQSRQLSLQEGADANAPDANTDFDGARSAAGPDEPAGSGELKGKARKPSSQSHG